MAFFLNSAQREGTALLEDSFCAGRCGQQRHNTGHTSGDCALPPPPPSAPLSPPPPPSAPLSTPAPPSAATSPAAAATTTRTRWLRGRALGGGVQSGPTAVGASTQRPAQRWMDRRVGALVRRRVGSSARRRSCATVRVDAPAPGASAVCAPVPEWQGRLGRGNRITARQTKAAAVRGQQ